MDISQHKSKVLPSQIEFCLRHQVKKVIATCTCDSKLLYYCIAMSSIAVSSLKTKNYSSNTIDQSVKHLFPHLVLFFDCIFL
jgi:hypothetical protein